MLRNGLILVAILVGFGTQVKAQKIFTKGKVKPKTFHYTSKFETAKTLMLVPMELEGITRNFLFDTGAQLTAIRRDSIFGKEFDVRGAAKRTLINGSENVPLIKIADVEFRKTFANNSRFDGLTEQIDNFGGILGRNIIGKVNWLIDYPNKTFTISSDKLFDETFYRLPMNKQKHAPFTTIEINGKSYELIMDLGSTSMLNVPEDSQFAKDLQEQYEFKTSKRWRYTVGGNQEIVELVSVVPMVRIDELEFRDVSVNINISSQPRVGLSFFKDCQIVIDQETGDYLIKIGD